MFRPGDTAGTLTILTLTFIVDMAIIEYIRDDLTMTEADFGVKPLEVPASTPLPESEEAQTNKRIKEDL